jgi:hypothetical protein
LFDLTREESISALKFDLIKKDSLTRPDIVEQIQENLGAMLNIPKLRTGFISYNKERQLLQSVGFGFWNSLVMSGKKNVKIDDAFCKTANKFAFEKNQPLVFQHIDEKVSDENII